MLKLVRGMSTTHAVGPVQLLIQEKLQETFKPLHLKVLCESYMHNVPKGAEKHFNVQIVSDQFEGKTVLQRHRLVNACLADELAETVHALRIDAQPPSKWFGQQPTPSPSCLGGSKF